jgi:pimeloyl-ACP methyl ester carboxylesterase
VIARKTVCTAGLFGLDLRIRRRQLGFRASSISPIDRIKDYAKRLLLLAGSADTGTPPSETQALFAAANAPKELVVFDGAGHECLLERDPALWLSKVLPFLEEHLGQSVGQVQNVEQGLKSSMPKLDRLLEELP